MKRFLLYLMSALGFGLTACDGGNLDAYGVPHVRFHLSARVVDEAGKPIEGIEARAEGDIFESRTGVSNYLGIIEAEGSVWPGAQYSIEFIDPDGEANGGEFETLTLDITDKVVMVEEGYGGWYEGSYKADLGDVTLKKVESDEEDEITE